MSSAAMDVGRWAGRSLTETGVAEPEAFAAWISAAEAAPHGGESIVDLLDRIAPWLDARSRDKGRTLVVTHPSIN